MTDDNRTAGAALSTERNGERQQPQVARVGQEEIPKHLLEP